ncbi:DUF1996 domain-containing protein [Humibacter antri]
MTNTPGDIPPTGPQQRSPSDPQQGSPSGRQRRNWRIPLIVAVAVVGSLAIAGASSATTLAISSASASHPLTTQGAASVNTAGFPTGGRNPGIFTDRCPMTKEAPDDPIMMPGMTGASMQHDFFGFTQPTASTVTSDLVGKSTSCTTTADSSAYWLPVLYQNGTALKPSSALIYWRAPAASAKHVQAMPQGMTMIAGDEKATTPQSDKIIDWTCTQGKNEKAMPASNAPHDCTAGHYVRLVVTFPNCWDGHSLNGKGQQNVVYAASNGACPSSHPVQIPQIVFHVYYPTHSGSGITLSIGPNNRGPATTGHADFMNGWTQQRMNADTAACIDTQTRCGPVTGPDATPQGGKAEPTKARQHKNHMMHMGTSTPTPTTAG